MNPTPDTTTAGNSGNFDPRQAAALLDQTTQQARRHPVHVSYRQRAYDPAGGDVPQPYCPVGAGGGQGAPVRAERH